jgi:unsaturated rhamnogalacturonyl hydrolase
VLSAQTWVDTLDRFARTVYLPPNQFFWSWQHAPLLHAAEYQYDRMTEAERDQYYHYVKGAMDRNTWLVNGTSPNAIASGTGLAFAYRVSRDNTYLDQANRVFNDYLSNRFTSNGGVSHLIWAPELWDDTVYMIGVFFLSMYRATGDASYIDELIEQYRAHREKLFDADYGLWVHGWDDDDDYDFDFCSQPDWADPDTRRSAEYWGRGNGWIVVTLSELLNTLDENHPEWDYIAERLVEMIEYLPQFQDAATGHWYQLPVRAGEEGNFLESSCTAMFALGILTALQHGLVEGPAFREAVDRAYYGLRQHSLLPIVINGNDHLTAINVCGGTCIGDKNYYFNRPVVNGEAYALAMFIIFGRAYEDEYLNDAPTPVNDLSGFLNEATLYPVPARGSAIFLRVKMPYMTRVTIRITDLSGRVHHIQYCELQPGHHRYALDAGKLDAGIYRLSIHADETGQGISKMITLQ